MKNKSDMRTLYIVFRDNPTVGKLRTIKGAIKADVPTYRWDEYKRSVHCGRWVNPAVYDGVLCDRWATLRVIRGGKK